MNNHDCGCGGNHHHHHDNGDCCEEHMHTVVISLDGETDLTCNIIGTFDVGEGDDNREYIALQPVDDEEVLIFRYSEKDGDVSLDNIESDEEYEEVAEVFYGLMSDDEDFDDDLDDIFDFDEDDLDEDDLDEDFDDEADEIE